MRDLRALIWKLNIHIGRNVSLNSLCPVWKRYVLFISNNEYHLLRYISTGIERHPIPDKSRWP
ncbi:hypothetical protein M752DRAFT_78663 [Aspergillus phoenicis ATCC 13157]|uniref:Uncharacterized protein n=1 Tax=Aspergillus phoenicis ATCC 13157 TaxID=1353007 RepID=A0A370P896_ASPPH|nr:hypothetical protein M752DRAFT_78663 [Aspergillus phoenicis ATCC 13157]